MRVLSLMLTDVEGSTRLWQDEPGEMNDAMRRHHAVLHDLVERHAGWLPRDQGEGDAIFAAFASPSDALACAVDAQRALAAECWPTSRPLRVRIAVHTGELLERDGNLFGEPVSRCARLRGLGSGGQTLASAVLRDLVRDRLPADVSLVDLGEHRMKDLTRPERVWQVNVAGLPASFPALASLDRARHNLPVQLSSFVGREVEARDVIKLLDEHRLVTITGFGGMGKTRLALHVAAEHISRAGNEAWFVDLTEATTHEDVPALVGRALELATVRGEEIALALQSREALVVLDNFEHVLSAGTFVSQVLSVAPKVRVLATSRSPLRLGGEREYPLGPLAPTEGGTAPSPSLDEAARLFLDRALAVRPGLVIDDSVAAAATEICRRMDGMPLAIELAAARVRTMSPEALLPRLEQALTVLVGGRRDAPARHRTLRATIEWSYQALNPEDQQLLHRMAVLPAAADLPALEAVCGPDLDVFSALESLVETSLVRVVHSAAGDRYDLLTSIRQFAAGRLDPGEERDLRDRHATHYAALLRRDPPVTLAWSTQLGQTCAQEIAHISAAWDHRAATDDLPAIATFPMTYPETLAWVLGDTKRAAAVLEAMIRAQPASTVEKALALRELVLLEAIERGSISPRFDELIAVADDLDRPDIKALTRLFLFPATTHQEVLANLEEVDRLLPLVTDDSPVGVEFLRAEFDQATSRALRFSHPHVALEAVRRAYEANPVRGLQFNVVRQLLLLGRYDEAFDVAGDILSGARPEHETQAAHAVAVICALALTELDRTDEALQLLRSWDQELPTALDVFIDDHRAVLAVALLKAGQLSAARTVAKSEPESSRPWLLRLACCLTARVVEGESDPAVSAAAAEFPHGDMHDVDVHLALLVETAIRTADAEQRVHLAQDVQARKGEVRLPAGYEEALQELLASPPEGHSNQGS